jgi:hypothetical protein
MLGKFETIPTERRIRIRIRKKSFRIQNTAASMLTVYIKPTLTLQTPHAKQCIIVKCALTDIRKNKFTRMALETKSF